MNHSKLCAWIVLLTIIVWKLMPLVEAQAGSALSNMAALFYLLIAFWAWSLQPKPKPKPAKETAKK